MELGPQTHSRYRGHNHVAFIQHLSSQQSPTDAAADYRSGGDAARRLTLDLGRVGVSDGGVYRCVADNYLGSDARAQRVNVVGAPAVGPMAPRKAVAGSAVWAHCPYKGYPIRKITWIKGGEGDMQDEIGSYI